MAFIVEDGTGKIDATSYCTVEFADAYFEDRGNAVWAAIVADTTKEVALIKATDYIDSRFGASFKGTPYYPDTPQALAFPRTAPCITGIPTVLKRACCEYALRALSAKLAPDPTVAANGGKVISERKVLGPLEKEIRYSEAVSIQLLKPYPAADMLLRALFNSGNRVIR